MLCVHLWHHLQSIARKIQVTQVSASVTNFLANKNNKARATLGISNSEHHREQLSILSGNLSPFSGIFL